jgi:putative transposase
VRHRTNRHLHNHPEQDHRGIKQRTHPMSGCQSFVAAVGFCRVYDEMRYFFRVRSQRHESLALAWPRARHGGQLRIILSTLAVA